MDRSLTASGSARRLELEAPIRDPLARDAPRPGVEVGCIVYSTAASRTAVLARSM
jgi:hypothetical protein